MAFSAADLCVRQNRSIGIINVARGLIQGMNDLDIEVVVRCDSAFKDSIGEYGNNVKFDIIPQALGGVARVKWECFSVVKWAEKLDADWLFLPKGFAPLFKSSKVKLCCYVHDVMLDFYASHFREQLSMLQKYYFPLLYRRTLRDADLIVTSCEYTKSEIFRLGGRGDIEVVGIGFEMKSDPQVSDKAESEYDVLMFGSPQPHKLASMVENQLHQFMINHPLDLRIAVLGMTEGNRGWECFSRLDEMEYAELLAKSKVVIYASEYEGFGMPPIERLASEQGVMASNIRPISDHIAEDLLFKNDDQSSFDEALFSALERESWKGLLKVDIKSWRTIAIRCCDLMEDDLALKDD